MACTITVVPNSECPWGTRNRKLSYDFVWSGTYGATNGAFKAAQLGLSSVVQIEQVIVSDRSSSLGQHLCIYDTTNQEVRLWTAGGSEASGSITDAWRVTFIYQP